jgi:hypothetical protein
MNPADDIEDRSEFRLEPDDRDDADAMHDDRIDRETERRFLADAQRHLLDGQRAEVTDAAVEGQDSLWDVQS